MKHFFLRFGVCLVSLFFIWGCQDIASKCSFGQSKEVKISGPLLVQVNDWKMGLEDFEKRLKALEPVAKQQNLDIASYEFKARVLNELLRNALLAEEAKARKLYEEDDVIEAFARYKQNLLAQKLLMKETGAVTVTDVEVEGFYKQNQQYFKVPAQVRLRELVVGDEKKAKALYIRLLQGEDFAAVASENSQAASKEKGGDLGYIPYDPNTRFKKFWDIVSTLDKQEVSSIFKGEDNKFYIVKVEDKRVQAATPLTEEVRANIRRALGTDKRNKAVQALVETARKNAKVVINDDLLR